MSENLSNDSVQVINGVGFLYPVLPHVMSGEFSSGVSHRKLYLQQLHMTRNRVLLNE